MAKISVQLTKEFSSITYEFKQSNRLIFYKVVWDRVNTDSNQIEYSISVYRCKAMMQKGQRIVTKFKPYGNWYKTCDQIPTVEKSIQMINQQL